MPVPTSIPSLKAFSPRDRAWFADQTRAALGGRLLADFIASCISSTNIGVRFAEVTAAHTLRLSASILADERTGQRWSSRLLGPLRRQYEYMMARRNPS